MFKNTKKHYYDDDCISLNISRRTCWFCNRFQGGKDPRPKICQNCINKLFEINHSNDLCCSNCMYGHFTEAPRARSTSPKRSPPMSPISGKRDLAGSSKNKNSDISDSIRGSEIVLFHEYYGREKPRKKHNATHAMDVVDSLEIKNGEIRNFLKRLAKGEKSRQNKHYSIGLERDGFVRTIGGGGPVCRKQRKMTRAELKAFVNEIYEIYRDYMERTYEDSDDDYKPQCALPAIQRKSRQSDSRKCDISFDNNSTLCDSPVLWKNKNYKEPSIDVCTKVTEKSTRSTSCDKNERRSCCKCEKCANENCDAIRKNKTMESLSDEECEITLKQAKKSKKKECKRSQYNKSSKECERSQETDRSQACAAQSSASSMTFTVDNACVLAQNPPTCSMPQKSKKTVLEEVMEELDKAIEPDRTPVFLPANRLINQAPNQVQQPYINNENIGGLPIYGPANFNPQGYNYHDNYYQQNQVCELNTNSVPVHAAGNNNADAVIYNSQGYECDYNLTEQCALRQNYKGSQSNLQQKINESQANEDNNQGLVVYGSQNPNQSLDYADENQCKLPVSTTQNINQSPVCDISNRAINMNQLQVYGRSNGTDQCSLALYGKQENNKSLTGGKANDDQCNFPEFASQNVSPSLTGGRNIDDQCNLPIYGPQNINQSNIGEAICNDNQCNLPLYGPQNMNQSQVGGRLNDEDQCNLQFYGPQNMNEICVCGNAEDQCNLEPLNQSQVCGRPNNEDQCNLQFYEPQNMNQLCENANVQDQCNLVPYRPQNLTGSQSQLGNDNQCNLPPFEPQNYNYSQQCDMVSNQNQNNVNENYNCALVPRTNTISNQNACDTNAIENQNNVNENYSCALAPRINMIPNQNACNTNVLENQNNVNENYSCALAPRTEYGYPTYSEYNSQVQPYGGAAQCKAIDARYPSSSPFNNEDKKADCAKGQTAADQLAMENARLTDVIRDTRRALAKYQAMENQATSSSPCNNANKTVECSKRLTAADQLAHENVKLTDVIKNTKRALALLYEQTKDDATDVVTNNVCAIAKTKSSDNIPCKTVADGNICSLKSKKPSDTSKAVCNIAKDVCRIEKDRTEKDSGYTTKDKTKDVCNLSKDQSNITKDGSDLCRVPSSPKCSLTEGQTKKKSSSSKKCSRTRNQKPCTCDLDNLMQKKYVCEVRVLGPADDKTCNI